MTTVPYYVYRIERVGAIPRLEAIGSHQSYAGAAAECKRLRAVDQAMPAGSSVRMIFAENPLQAEDLLSEHRTPGPSVGDDY